MESAPPPLPTALTHQVQSRLSNDTPSSVDPPEFPTPGLSEARRTGRYPLSRAVIRGGGHGVLTDLCWTDTLGALTGVSGRHRVTEPARR